ncbi:uncharacterized protein LOC135468344 [Liolophura sinensis]|uniref:uncharacterized protein LOC135468344 n=1 Tax=Liolophura sinensis TaxID=3198878 RepID=UPI00315956B9
MISSQNGDNVNLMGEVSDLESNHYPQSSSPGNHSKRRGTGTQQGMMEYNHHIQMSNVDDISKQLDDMKENLIKTSVRCHMLEVDLATQFSPYMVDTLRSVKQECEKCTQKMKQDERCQAKESKSDAETVPNNEF